MYSMQKSVVGICADSKRFGLHDYHCVGVKYVRAVRESANALPVLLPALSGENSITGILDDIDGIVLTGSYANVHPKHYNGGKPYESSPLDSDRDEAAFEWIPAALERGIPLLGICRGFQELNVALGGTLHQKVHEQPGLDHHLEDSTQPLDVQYGPAHPVTLVKGGQLARMSASLNPTVNSLHGQGINRLADGLSVEATARDGLVEAFAVDNVAAFALAVQWHPEWSPGENSFYAALWTAFGDACRTRAGIRAANAWSGAGEHLKGKADVGRQK